MYTVTVHMTCVNNACTCTLHEYAHLASLSNIYVRRSHKCFSVDQTCQYLAKWRISRTLRRCTLTIMRRILKSPTSTTFLSVSASHFQLTPVLILSHAHQAKYRWALLAPWIELLNTKLNVFRMEEGWHQEEIRNPRWEDLSDNPSSALAHIFIRLRKLQKNI